MHARHRHVSDNIWNESCWIWCVNFPRARPAPAMKHWPPSLQHCHIDDRSEGLEMDIKTDIFLPSLIIFLLSSTDSSHNSSYLHTPTYLLLNPHIRRLSTNVCFSFFFNDYSFPSSPIFSFYLLLSLCHVSFVIIFPLPLFFIFVVTFCFSLPFLLLSSKFLLFFTIFLSFFFIFLALTHFFSARLSLSALGSAVSVAETKATSGRTEQRLWLRGPEPLSGCKTLRRGSAPRGQVRHCVH
jgi:hypothetical protein